MRKALGLESTTETKVPKNLRFFFQRGVENALTIVNQKESEENGYYVSKIWYYIFDTTKA